MINEAIKEHILEMMASPKYQPMSKSELGRALDIPSKEKLEFRALIDEMERSGVIIHLKKAKYALKKASQKLTPGTIRILNSGKILFFPDLNATEGTPLEGIKELVVYPANRLNSALSGDSVRVQIEQNIPRGWHRRHKGRPTAEDMEFKVRVKEVTKRARTTWLGTYVPWRKWGRVLGDGIGSPKHIELTEKPAMEVFPEQLVAIEPSFWGDDYHGPQGKIVEVLGYPDDPHVDVESVICKYNLRTEFPEQVLKEAAKFTIEATPEELEKREDWSDRLVITIDPATAKDFDDAIHIETTKDGWRLAVHIADVSHFVKKGTALDKEAQERGNSTYLPDRVLPMLPHELCDDLCSLVPDQMRLTKVAIMDFNHHGVMTHARFADAYICSKARLTYQQAHEMLKNPDPDSPVSCMVNETWKLASILRKNRFEQGALDLDFPEVKAILDENGRVKEIQTEEYDESHQLIEECMLAANEAVAYALKTHNRPTIYRVHDDPKPDKLAEFGQLCKLYGHPVHDLSLRTNLNKLLMSIKGSPDEQLLKLALLKSLMRAQYDTEPSGHFGLAKENYCHFTSPIRRYADLVVHRSLTALLSNSPNKSAIAGHVGELAQVAEHISETERTSASAEKEANFLKLYEWLENQCYAEHPEHHKALITEVRNMGLFIEIPRLQIKGLIKEEGFPPGKWVMETFASRWKNDAGLVLCQGMTVDVVPIRVNRAQQWVDFACV